MLKRVLILTLSFLLLLTIVSCDLYDAPILAPEYKDKVDFVSSGNKTHHIVYADSKYLLHDESIISVEISDDIFLGWVGSWFGYVNKYYSSTMDNPLFIYETRMDFLYLREDYDFHTDYFVIDGTDSEILFSNAIVYNDDCVLDNNIIQGVNIVLYSKMCPRLKIYLRIFKYEDIWYASTMKGEIYIVTEDLANVLIENKVISY